MKMKKWIVYHGFAVAINTAFQNRLHQSIYMMTLSAILSVCLLPITKGFIDFWLFLSVISLCLSLTTVRLSNNSMYSPITKHLSMNIGNYTVYHQWNYIKQKREIAELYQEEFIQAIEKAYEKGFHTIKMTTHVWVLYKVLLHERVLSRYDVVYKITGTTKIPLEVLLLSSKTTMKNEIELICQEAVKERKQVKILLKRK